MNLKNVRSFAWQLLFVAICQTNSKTLLCQIIY